MPLWIKLSNQIEILTENDVLLKLNELLKAFEQNGMTRKDFGYVQEDIPAIYFAEITKKKFLLYDPYSDPRYPQEWPFQEEIDHFNTVTLSTHVALIDKFFTILSETHIETLNAMRKYLNYFAFPRIGAIFDAFHDLYENDQLIKPDRGFIAYRIPIYAIRYNGKEITYL